MSQVRAGAEIRPKRPVSLDMIPTTPLHTGRWHIISEIIRENAVITSFTDTRKRNWEQTARMTHFVLEILDNAPQGAGLAGEAAASRGTRLEEGWLGDVVMGGRGRGGVAEDGGVGEEEGGDDDPVVAQRAHRCRRRGEGCCGGEDEYLCHDQLRIYDIREHVRTCDRLGGLLGDGPGVVGRGSHGEVSEDDGWIYARRSCDVDVVCTYQRKSSDPSASTFVRSPAQISSPTSPAGHRPSHRPHLRLNPQDVTIWSCAGVGGERLVICSTGWRPRNEQRFAVIIFKSLIDFVSYHALPIYST